MKFFWKHAGICLIWLLLSEILCFVLAFSFAILSAAWIRWLSLLCGIAAHIMLMGSCGQRCGKEDAADFRLTGDMRSPLKPLLLGILAMLPQILVYLLLTANQDSVLMLNLFPLLQSPFIQLHRLLIAGQERFRDIPAANRILMALPPLITALSVYAGYRFEYLKNLAKQNAQKKDSNGAL